MYGRKITLSVTCVEPAQLVRDVGARFHKYYTYHLKANGCYKRMGVSDYRKFAGFAVLSRPKSASDKICSTQSPLLPNLPPASIIQILKMKFISYLSFHPLLFCYG